MFLCVVLINSDAQGKFPEIEIPLIEVLSDMEQNGMLLNSKILASQSILVNL